MNRLLLKKLVALVMCVTLLASCVPAISEESLTDQSAVITGAADPVEDTGISSEPEESNEAVSETSGIADAAEDPSEATDDTAADAEATAEPEAEAIDTEALTNTVISDIIAEMNAKSLSDELEKAEWLYGMILAIASHGDGNTVYDALVAGSADSEGYALAYTALLNEAGITAQTVYGESGAWVVARLNGSYVHIDAYADDASSVYGKNFALTDDAMACRHEWDRTSVPACTDADLNYYVRHEGYTIISDAESLHAALAEATDTVKLYNAFGLDLQETLASFDDVDAVIKEDGCYAIAAVTALAANSAEDGKPEITVTTQSITLGVGQEKKISYTVYPTGSSVFFYTTAESVCTVSSKGVLTALKAGTSTITLATSGAAVQISVKVVAAPTAVSLVSDHYIAADDALYIGIGEKIQLDYSTTPAAAKEIANVSYSVGSSSYATVTSGGELKGVKLGSTSVKLTCYNGFNVSKYVKIIAAPSSLTMDSGVLTLGVGEISSSKATIGNDTHGVFTVEYASKDSSVAVVDSKGNIAAVGIGETDIEASTYNGLTASRHIKVVAAPETLTINGDYTTVAIGEKLQLSCSMLPEGCSGSITWTSSSTSYATVTSSGLVTPKKAGSVKITAKAYNGVSCTYDITIKAAVTKAALTIPTKTIGLGESVPTGYKLTGFTNSFLYKSLSPDIASIDADGVVTGNKLGTAKLYLKAGTIVSSGVTIEVVAAPKSITASQHTATLCRYDSLTIGYTLTEGSASLIDYSSSDESVAIVDENGIITAVGLGTADITLSTFNGLTDVCTVTVIEEPTEVTITADRTTLGVGETMQTAIGFVPEASVGTITVTNSKSSVATFSNTGLITAKKAGTTVITVKTYNGLTAKLTVTVKSAPKSVTISASRTTIGVGESIATSYKLSSGAGGAITQYVTQSQYTGSGGSYLTIDENGIVTGKKIGSEYVGCITYNGKKSNALKFTVVAAPTSITPGVNSVSVGVGNTATLKYTLSNGCTGGVVFTSADPDICTVDESTGKITAVKEGTTTVTLETYNHVTCNVEVTVTPAPESIVFDSSSVTIGIGQTLKLAPGLLPEGSASTFKYASSKTKYATVSSSGVVTGKKAGSSVITVTAYNGVTAKLTVTVKKAPTSVKITAPYTSIGVGESEVLGVSFSSGSAGSISKYASSDTSIVTIDADGIYRGVSEGTAYLMATSYNGKKSNILTITVGSAPESIAFDRDTYNLCINDSCTPSYTIFPATTCGMTFVSDDPGVASVNAQTGKTTAVAKGTCRITLTAYNSVSAVCTVVVEDEPTGISISTDKATIGVGEKLQLNAVLEPQNSAATVTYSVSSSSYATVDKYGILTGVSAGTVTVTAKTYNGHSESIKIKVVKAPSNIAFTQSEFAIGEDEAVDLTPYLKITSGTSCTYTFTSSDESVCSIDSNGTITGEGVGTATITAATHNGKTAYCTVSVAYAPTFINLDMDDLLIVGEEYELTSAVGPDEDNYASFFRNYTITSGTCVEINDAGRLEATETGTATVRVETYLPTVYDELRVTVRNAPTFVTFASTSYEVDIEDTLQLSPIIDDDAFTTFTYTIGKEGYFTISDTGLLTPISRGTTTVTVTTHNGISATVTVTVVDPNFPEAIDWTNVDDNPPTYMSADGTNSYPKTWVPQVTVTPSSSTAEMSWSSSDETVLKYDTASGAFTAISYGTATVTGRSARNPALVLTAKVTVINKASESHCLTVPTQFLSIKDKSTSEISSIISNNETTMYAIKNSAYADLDALKADGTITSGETSSRKKILDRAFAMLDFPWTTSSQVSYWISDYDSSSYYTWISGTKYVGHSKDYRTNVLYFGLPYTQTWRNYNQSNIVSGGWYSSKSNGKYTLNTSKFSGRNYRGNDCSSFVSQSEWGSGYYDNTTAIASSSKYTTLSSSSAATLRPGDILVRSGHHVVMFLYYTNAAKTQFMIIEQGGSDDYNTNVVACRIRNTSSYSSYKLRRPNL